MLWVEEYNGDKFELVIKDTDDGVSEALPLEELPNIKKSGIKIFGTYAKTFVVCEESKHFLAYANVKENKVIFCNKQSGVIFELSGDKVFCDRNDPLIYSVGHWKSFEDYDVFRVVCSVKFDIEFTGCFFVSVSKNRNRAVDKTELMFVENDESTIEEAKEQTCGDCPDFVDTEYCMDKVNALSGI